MQINTAYRSHSHVIMWLSLGFFLLAAIPTSEGSITAGYVDHGDMKGECGCGGIYLYPIEQNNQNMIRRILPVDSDKYL